MSIRLARSLVPAPALALSVVLAGIAPALAYIPSADSLLRKASARVNEGGKSKEATLSGWLQLGDAAPVSAKLELKFPLACKLDAGGRTASVRGDPANPKAEDAGLGAGAIDLLRLACPLVAYRGLPPLEAEAALRAATQHAGVAPELTPTSLSRLYDRVAIVLGAGSRQLDRPQLWLYKETGAPARLLARQGQALDDLRLLQYGNPAVGEWFPRALELWRGEQLVARFEALEIAGFRDAPPTEDQDEE